MDRKKATEIEIKNLCQLIYINHHHEIEHGLLNIWTELLSFFLADQENVSEKKNYL